jgi:oxygen-dependent protoporphyrinogen oxidase
MGLEQEMIITPKTADAARNRYIYYPDRLVKMPNDISSMVQGLLNEPIFKGAIKGALSELLRRDNNYRDDESIGDFLTRRMGTSDIADNIVSAVLHGIYAGDIYQLSMISLMPEIWNFEREDGSFIIGMLAKKIDEALSITNPKAKYSARILTNVHKMERWSELEEASVYTFKRGIAQLAETMERYLRRQKNVTIETSTNVKKLELDVNKQAVKVWHSSFPIDIPNPLFELLPNARRSTPQPTNPPALSIASSPLSPLPSFPPSLHPHSLRSPLSHTLPSSL